MAVPLVSATILVRNMAGTVGETIRSVRPHVDEVCVLDTGSTDGTLELLAALAAEPGVPVVVEQAAWPGSFGEARALNTAMASHDWVLTLDADELLVDGELLGAAIDAAQGAGAGRVWLSRDYAEGLPPHLICRLFDRGQGRWQGLVHERWFAPQTGQLWLSPRPGEPGGVSIYHLRRQPAAEAYDAGLEQAVRDPDRYDTPYAHHLLAYRRLTQGRWKEGERLARIYLDRWADRDGRFHGGHLDTLVYLCVAYSHLRDVAALHRTWRQLSDYLDEYATDGADELPPQPWIDAATKAVGLPPRSLLMHVAARDLKRGGIGLPGIAHV